MTTSTTTLSDFLLARIAKDEESARVEYGRRDVILTGAFSPARILAECDAKRLLVEELARMDRDEMGWDGIEAKIMGYLALPYADHPDYNPAWRP